MLHPLQAARNDLRAAQGDAGFEEALTRVARTGTVVGASVGLLALGLILVLAGVHDAFFDPMLTWRYDKGLVSLWDAPVLATFCLIGLASARHLSLGGVRLLVATFVVVGTLTTMADDVFTGRDAFTPFIALPYLVAIAAVPYRPGQVMALGGALVIPLALCTTVVPAAAGVPTVENVPGHFLFLATITVVLAGVSALLYLTRYWQYRAHHEAEQAQHEAERAQHEAERLYEQVQALEAAKSRFFTNLSHELRTPLTLLLGPIEEALAGRYEPVGPRLRRNMRVMQEQARGLQVLVDEMLDLAKLESGTMPLRVREHDLSALVRRHVEMFRSAADRSGVALSVEAPDSALPVWMDLEKIERVVSNLLANALKHTPEGGALRVRVGTMGEPAVAVVSVRDSGEGIAEEALATVFDRFSGEPGARGIASTGIGLALVKETVERHGGEVAVRSEPGFGAEFDVRLPLGNAHVAPSDLASDTSQRSDTQVAPTARLPHEEHPPDHAPPTEPTLPEDAPLVLIADDNGPVRTYIRDLLGADYHVLEATDGTEAWALVGEHRPDLVISDVMMPELDGFGLCRRIRDDEHLATTPIVLLTARAEEEARLEGLKTGADAYLAKPFSAEELRAVTEHLIEVRRLLRDRVRVPDWMEPNAETVPSPDAEFLHRVQRAVEAHIGDASFGVDWLAGEVGISARHLQRRLKGLTRLTAAGFIKAMRLEHAARLLDEPGIQVQEVAHAVGYADVEHFARLFRQAYGAYPSDYGSTV